MKFKVSYPNSLPIVGGMVGTLLCVSYYMGLWGSQLILGRPSSTWILGFFWLPMLAWKPALVGLLVGAILRLFLRPFRLLGESPPARKVLWLFLILLVSISFITGVTITFKEFLRWGPHVVQTTGKVVKLEKLPSGYEKYTNTVSTWDLSAKESSPQIAWNGRKISVYSTATSIVITDEQQVINRVNLDDQIWYVATLFAIPVKLRNDTGASLAVLAQVRTILDCYILTILDAEGHAIYQEILDRKKRVPTPMQKATNRVDGSEILLIDVGSLIVYGSR